MQNDGVKRVQLPNGDIAEFPQSMADNEIERQLSLQFPAQRQPTNAPVSSQSLISKLANNPITNSVLGAGDSIRDLLSLGTTSKSPTGSGTAYNVGKFGGDIAGFLGGGEVLDAARAAGEGIPLAGKALQYLGKGGMIPGAARGITGSAIGGAAISPDNRTQGALTGGALGAAAETIPFALRGGAAISELLNPKKFAGSLGDTFAKDYLRARAKAGEYYNLVTDKLGNNNIYQGVQKLFPGGAQSILSPHDTYMGLDQDVVKKYFTPKVKKLHDDFMDNPTLSNAHRLQSQLGSEAARLSKASPDAVNIGTQQSMEYARDVLNKDLNRYLMSTDPQSAAAWKKGNDIFKSEAAPYRANKTLFDMARGKRQTISPAQAKNTLTKAVESGDIPESHPITKALNQLTNKIERGKGIDTLIPPLYKNFSPVPKGIEFAGNPYMQKVGNKLSPYYGALKNSIIASMINGNNQK